MSWRQRAGYFCFDVFDGAAHAVSRIGRGLDRSSSAAVEVLRDLPFLPTGDAAHTLDLFRPRQPGPHPIVFYVHGGAFLSLSKDTHFSVAMSFARRGHLVCNINYRLAPAHRFPAALMDCIAAYEWLVRNAPAYDGDLRRVALVGESAGANLITSLALCIASRREEPWAQTAFDLGVVPRAVLPLCGLLHASGLDALRPSREPLWFRSMRSLLRDYPPIPESNSAALLDPLLILENGFTPERRLPPFFIAVGTRDPLLENSQRLDAALRRLEVPVEAHYYSGEGHAFHMLPWRRQSRECWRDLFEFVAAHTGSD